jgi:5-methylcytosine-specific restriction endonuclease McrA
MSTSVNTKRRYRQRGVCVDCGGGTNAGGLRCGKCKQKDGIYQKERRRQWVARGCCGECGKLPRRVGLVCLPCWFRKTSRNRTGTHASAGVLEELWLRQGARCAYTGEQLTPGVNASLDHKVPVSRGGGHTERNLQWVAERVNRMKTDMTHAEFIAACKDVAVRFAAVGEG